MLRDRIITAVVLVPLLLLAIFAAPHAVFVAVVGAVILGAAWEWTALMNCVTRTGRWLFVIISAAAMLGSLYTAAKVPVFLEALVVVALVWWIGVLAWLTSRPHDQPSQAACAFKGVCGMLTLVPLFVVLAVLHAWDDGPWRVLFLLALVWLADVGAYFAGRRFGERKLAPEVSPGKTWAGVAGAFAVASLVILGGWAGGLGFGPAWYFVSVCLLVVAISIIGDLSESMFKRQQGIKDSGSLLPGHGGLLDRIDSLTAAAPALLAGMLLAGAFPG